MSNHNQNHNYNYNLNNYNNNSQFVRTPLQPKSVNKNIQIDSNAKFTPIKFPNLTNLNEKEKLVNFCPINEIKPVFKNFFTEFSEKIENSEINQQVQNLPNESNTMNEYLNPSEAEFKELTEKEENYNKNKECINIHQENSPKIIYAPIEDYSNSFLESTEEKTKKKKIKLNSTPITSSKLQLQKAIYFFDTENLFHMNMVDIKNREKIDKYIHEDLFFVDEDE
jgi:hypothetical protein